MVLNATIEEVAEQGAQADGRQQPAEAIRAEAQVQCGQGLLLAEQGWDHRLQRRVEQGGPDGQQCGREVDDPEDVVEGQGEHEHGALSATIGRRWRSKRSITTPARGPSNRVVTISVRTDAETARLE
jgi:hypothetical protein